MKILASTKGDFMLVSAPDQIEAERPSVVTWTGFWEQRVALGQITVHGRLVDEVTDADWAKVMKDAMAKAESPEAKSKALAGAIDAFCTQHNIDQEQVVVPKKEEPKKVAAKTPAQ
jgi:hypothetical protein